MKHLVLFLLLACQPVPTDQQMDDTLPGSTGSTGSTGTTGSAEECVKQLQYRDADGDGYGGRASTQCSGATGYVAASGDCDDSSALHWSDCNDCVDMDGDGGGANCDLGGDCDDNPDTGDACLSGCVDGYLDQDGDGTGSGAISTRCAGATGYVSSGDDCDDSFNTGSGCTNGCTAGYFDQDHDGHGGASAGPRCSLPTGFAGSSDDCDDSTATGASCFNTCATFYRDVDGDTFGDDALAVSTCIAGSGYVGATGDCAPTNGAHWADCGACTDADEDNHGGGCDLGDDCSDSDVNNWDKCATCADFDMDGSHGGCDAYVNINGPDCDDRNPLVRPGAFDLPDNGFAEDCQPPDTHATEVGGWFVRGGIGCVTGNGSASAPFCDLQEAFTAATPGDSVYVAAGTYAFPASALDLRLFGGYSPTGWTVRDFTTHATTLQGSSYPYPWVNGVLMHGFNIEMLNDCEDCAVLGVGLGSASLIDVTLRPFGTLTQCTSLYIFNATATLVRVTTEGGGCGMHIGLLTSDADVSVWSSDLRGGYNGKTTGAAYAASFSGNARIVDTKLRSEADTSAGVWQTSGVLHFLSNDALSIGTSVARGVIVTTTAYLENNWLRASANDLVVGVSSDGTTNIMSNTINLTATNDAYGVDQIAGPARIMNNLFTAVGAAPFGVRINFGASGTLYNNSFSGSAGYCPLYTPADGCVSNFTAATPAVNSCNWTGCDASADNFGDACVVDGDGRLSTGSPCIDSGRDLTGEVAYAWDFEGDVRPIGAEWDVGRDEHTP